MEKIKVSIIMPIYNTEKYLSECMDSVINQTLNDIEIICVDDGSTDGSGEILDAYAEKDERIHVIHKENTGYGNSVNIGILAAKGEYVGIVEPDDYIALDMMECLYRKASEFELDVVKGDFAEFEGNGENREIEYKQVINNEKLYYQVLEAYTKPDIFYGYVMNPSGIYNREFLLQYQIYNNETPGASYQDMGFWFQIVFYARRYMLLSQTVYFYRQDNPNSSINSRNKIYCICDEFEFIFKKLRKLMPEKQTKILPYFTYCMYNNYLLSYRRVSNEYKILFLKRMSDDFRKLQNMGMLDRSLLDQESNVHLKDIIEDFMVYYRESRKLPEAIHKIAENYENLIIYGAGKYAKRLFQSMDVEDREHLLGFAVTEIKNEGRKLNGYPIKDIVSYAETKETVGVLIGTSNQYSQEIKENLLEHQFQHVYDLQLG